MESHNEEGDLKVIFFFFSFFNRDLYHIEIIKFIEILLVIPKLKWYSCYRIQYESIYNKFFQKQKVRFKQQLGRRS